MRKVRTIFLMRRLVAPFAFLAVAVAVIVSTVSVSHVIENMPTIADFQATFNFFASAFAHTDVIVKSALVAGLVFLLVTLKGIADSVRLNAVLAKSS
ncbi:MAG TPA: hypothetical protein VGE35_01910 [Candidatus Paceibacterota bacterium]